MSDNSSFGSLCGSSSVVCSCSWFSLKKCYFLVCLVIFSCEQFISLKSYSSPVCIEFSSGGVAWPSLGRGIKTVLSLPATQLVSHCSTNQTRSSGRTQIHQGAFTSSSQSSRVGLAARHGRHKAAPARSPSTPVTGLLHLIVSQLLLFYFF